MTDLGALTNNPLAGTFIDNSNIEESIFPTPMPGASRAESSEVTNLPPSSMNAPDILLSTGSQIFDDFSVTNPSPKITDTIDQVSGSGTDLGTTGTSAIDDPYFDPEFYAKANLGFADAGITTPEQLHQHFKDFGLSEGRSFSCLFDVNFYWYRNPDLQAAGLTPQQLYDHWQNQGLAEGRQGSVLVDIKYYLEQNADVKEAFGNDFKAAFQHLQKYGIAEGRKFSPWVDLKYYLEQNTDLKEAFGENYKLALEHLKNHGLAEGRDFSPNFNLEVYLEKNQDVAEHFQHNNLLILDHWQNFGVKEGRQCLPDEWTISIDDPIETISIDYPGWLDNSPAINLPSVPSLENTSVNEPATSTQQPKDDLTGSILDEEETQTTVPASSEESEETINLPISKDNSEDEITNLPVSEDNSEETINLSASEETPDDNLTSPTNLDSTDTTNLETEPIDSSTIHEGNAPVSEEPAGEKLNPIITPSQTLMGVEAEPTPPKDLPPNAGGKNSKKNPAPKHFQIGTTQAEYLAGETIRLKDVWAFDASGAGDLDRIEFSLHDKTGKECLELENAPNFMISSKDDRWGWLNYQISGLAPGEYQLKGVAYDQAGGKSNTAVACFTVSQQALVTPLLGFIDTGFAAKNPDIDYSRITLGKDWVDGDDNPLLEVGEGNEHGTHILGLVAAIQNNGVGIYGINDQAKIWLGRAVGSGKWAESLMEFVDHAKASGQSNAVVNLSLDLTQIEADGTLKTRYELTPREREALEYARQNGVLIVVAAGNDGGVMSVLGQASQEFDNLITVGAANGNERANYSSFGQRGPDIMAEGGSLTNPITSTSGDDAGTMAGTSVATAQVTGTASLLWEANPELNYRQIIEALKSTATDLNVAGIDKETGAGLLNTEKAVETAKSMMLEDYVPAAFLTPETWSGEGKVTPSERAAADEFMGKWYDWETYTIQSGDTLSQIALDRMGNGSADYYNFIAQHNNIADPDIINAGDIIEVPYEVAAPISDSSNPSDNNTDINAVSFSGTVIATIGAIVRDEATTSSAQVSSRNYQEIVQFDAWKIGEFINQSDLGTQSDRWYRIAGTDDWISAALIDGSPDNQGTDNNNPSAPTISSVAQQYQLGNPTSEVIAYSSTISYQIFENGSVVSSQHGIFPLYGGVRQTYLNTGGLNGWLGAPTSAETGLGNGNIIQYFENGYIYWNGSTATAYQEGTEIPSENPLGPGNQPISGQPNFNLPAYRENNAFWQYGYAPISTNPPFTYLGDALGNCTWYANGRLQELGYSKYVLDSMLGHAGTWDDTAARGATVTYTPQVYCIAVWDPYAGGTLEWGHVAVVEQINSDGSILISESNWYNTAYSTRTIAPGTYSWPSKFITVPRA